MALDLMLSETAVCAGPMVTLGILIWILSLVLLSVAGVVVGDNSRTNT